MEEQNQATKDTIIKLKKFMFAHNVTQKDICRSGLVSYSYLNNVMNGKRNFSERMIYHIDEFLQNYESQDNQ